MQYVQFWSPHLQRDIIKIEKVQWKVSKTITAIINHSYSQWLKNLNFISLEQRRLRGQLIEVFKCQWRFNNATARGLFDRDLNDRTRNNGEKLIVKLFNTSIAKHFYPIKITTWNDIVSSLQSDIVSSRTMNTFKNCLVLAYLQSMNIPTKGFMS